MSRWSKYSTEHISPLCPNTEFLSLSVCFCGSNDPRDILTGSTVSMRRSFDFCSFALLRSSLVIHRYCFLLVLSAVLLHLKESLWCLQQILQVQVRYRPLTHCSRLTLRLTTCYRGRHYMLWQLCTKHLEKRQDSIYCRRHGLIYQSTSWGRIAH